MRRYAERKTVPLEMAVPHMTPANRAEIAMCESAYQIVSTWLWLSLRLADACPDRAAAEVCSLLHCLRSCVIYDFCYCYCYPPRQGSAYRLIWTLKVNPEILIFSVCKRHCGGHWCTRGLGFRDKQQQRRGTCRKQSTSCSR